MESEFVNCIKQVELENNMLLVIKVNGLTKKSEEIKEDLSTPEKLLLELNEKKRKLSADSSLLKFSRQYIHFKKNNETLSVSILNFCL